MEVASLEIATDLKLGAGLEYRQTGSPYLGYSTAREDTVRNLVVTVQLDGEDVLAGRQGISTRSVKTMEACFEAGVSRLQKISEA